MLNVIMLSVPFYIVILNVIMLSVAFFIVILNVIMLSVIMLSVVAPSKSNGAVVARLKISTFPWHRYLLRLNIDNHELNGF